MLGYKSTHRMHLLMVGTTGKAVYLSTTPKDYSIVSRNSNLHLCLIQCRLYLFFIFHNEKWINILRSKDDALKPIEGRKQKCFIFVINYVCYKNSQKKHQLVAFIYGMEYGTTKQTVFINRRKK